MQTVTSEDGTRIAYERHDGDGRPIVLLHGGLTHEYWRPVIPRLAGEYTLLAPDRRGRGDSGDAETYSIRKEVDDACAVIDTVDGDPVLFGHSFGGLQAIEAARRASVAGVVAYEPAYLVGKYRQEADLAARMQSHLDKGKPREAMKAHFREVMHGGEIEDFEAWLAEWPAWPDCVEHVENTVRMDRALEDHPLPDALDIDALALLLTGEDGPPHLRDSVRAVHDIMPDSRLVEFEGLGHGGPPAAPDRILAEVRDFLDEIDVAAGSA